MLGRNHTRINHMTTNNFTIIGENIHCTRVVKRGGIRGHVFNDGSEAVKYRVGGEQKFVRVPKHFENTQPYQQGNLKHFMIAVWKGVNGDSEGAAEGEAYIKYEIDRQTKAGAAYLDLNVDELSHRVPEQIEAMRWLVQYVQSVADVPPSIDSSNSEIIQAGLEAYDRSSGRPMVNSVALERLETLDLIAEHDATCIISSASERGMPERCGRTSRKRHPRRRRGERPWRRVRGHVYRSALFPGVGRQSIRSPCVGRDLETP